MSIERWSLAIAVVLVAGLQYGLAIYAVRDLHRRPSVRGNNKVAWGLLILGLPFIGPLLYTYMGPTSFIPRSRTSHTARPFPPPRPLRHKSPRQPISPRRTNDPEWS